MNALYPLALVSTEKDVAVWGFRVFVFCHVIFQIWSWLSKFKETFDRTNMGKHYTKDTKGAQVEVRFK